MRFRGVGRAVLSVGLVLGALCASAGGGTIDLDVVGALTMTNDDVTVSLIGGVVAGGGPTGFASDLRSDPQDGELKVHLVEGNSSKRCLEGPLRLAAVSNDTAEISGEFTALRAVSLPGGVGVNVTFPARSWANGRWTADGGFCGVMPPALKTFPLGSGKGRRAEFTRPDGVKLAVEFPEVVQISAFDGRAYGGTGVGVRFQTGQGAKLEKGGRIGFRCRIRRIGGLKVGCRPATVVAAGDDWVPFGYKKDIVAGSALDFSGMGFCEAPAGKYGWLRAVGGHFEFENRPGVVQRFYGVNLCGDATCPEKSVTDQLVRRLVRLGYNTIRIHHHESSLVEGSADNRAFNAENLDRLDYLIARAIENGLYVTTDLFVSRPVTWKAIGIDRPGKMSGNEYKSLLVLGHPGAFEDWRRFAAQWLRHVNPYTGRPLAEEPALVTLGLVNEGHLGMGWSRIRRMPIAQEAWEKWLNGRTAAELGLDPAAVPAKAASLQSRDTDAAYALFSADLEAEKVRKMSAVVRALGYRGLLFNDNNGPVFAAKEKTRAEVGDLVDNHCYVDHPHFIGANWRPPSRIEGANPFLAQNYVPARLGAMRLYAKPFTVTEWNHASVGVYRSTAGLLVGAIAAGQDWSGLWRFDYAHGARKILDTGGNVSSFDLSGDPLKQATDRMFALCYLRGDVPVLKPRMAFEITSAALRPKGPKATSLGLGGWTRQTVFEAQMGAVMSAAEAPGADVFPLEAVAGANEPPKRYDGGRSVTVDGCDGMFALVTPRTCGGLVEVGKRLSAGVLSAEARGHLATVSASSLDGRPIRSSSRILVTHLTDVLSEGARFADARHTVILAHGKDARPMMRVGAAEIGLTLDAPDDYEVWALDTAGNRERRVTCRADEDGLHFTVCVGPGRANMYYEVVKRGETEK